MRRTVYVITSFIFVIPLTILLILFLLFIMICALFVMPYTYATCKDIDDPFDKKETGK